MPRSMSPYGELNIYTHFVILHIGAPKKWQPFCRRQFLTFTIDYKYFNIDCCFFLCVPRIKTEEVNIGMGSKRQTRYIFWTKDT